MKKVVLLFLIIFWVLPLSISYAIDYQSGTEKQVNPNNGHAYQWFDTELNWSDAKIICEELGAHLVTITSQAENDWIIDYMTADAGLSIWIGGTDEAQDGVWEWVTGEPWNYTNWSSDEPNNFCGGESYVTLWALGSPSPRSWNDYGGPGCNSEETSSYICEWENSDGLCIESPLGLVSWWSGDGTAEDIADSNNGTLIGNVSFAQGKVDQAFLLHGSDYIDAGNASNLHVSQGDFTIDAWVYFNELSGDMSIMDKMSANGVNIDGWRLLKQADNRFWFCFGGGAGGNRCWDSAFTLFSTTVATTDSWFHVAIVKQADKFSMYINGSLEESRSPVPNFFDTNSASLRFGSYALEGSYLDGMVDEPEIFNRALSTSEIQAIYNAGSAGKCKNLNRDFNMIPVYQLLLLRKNN